MDELPPARTFTVPVALLMAGLFLAGLALMWLMIGTAPFIAEDGPPVTEPNRPWLPITAGLLSIAAFWAGFRALRVRA